MTRLISDGLHPGWFERFEPSFALALDAFIAALEGKGTPYPSLMDGLCAQIIAGSGGRNRCTRISRSRLPTGSLSNVDFLQHWRYHNDTYNRYRRDWHGLDGRSA